MHKIWQKKLLSVLALSYLTFTAEPGFSKYMGPGFKHVKIVLDKSSSKVELEYKNKKLETEWRKACKTLGTALAPEKGPFGFGIFDSASCWIGKKNIRSSSKNASLWEIHIKDDGKQVTIGAFRKIKAGAGKDKKETESNSTNNEEEDSSPEEKGMSLRPEASVQFPHSDKLLDILQNTEFAELIAYGLLDSMPALTRFGLDGYFAKASIASVQKQRRWALPKAPKNLIVFKLIFNSTTNYWLPRVIGQATLQENGSWTLDSDANKQKDSSEEPALYAANPTGRGSAKKQIEDLLKKASAELEKETGGGSGKVLSGGFVGVRYGIPFGTSGLFMPKAKSFALLAEVRGGPMSGLRFYYELVPTVTEETASGQELQYHSSRMTLGWSFGVDVDKFLISRIDLAPKIGIWNFTADIPVDVEGSADQLITRFQLNDTPSMGAEVGIESDFSWMIVRGWYAIDQAFGLLQKSSSGSVTGQRLGLDLIIEGPQIFGFFDIDLLLFVTQESTALSSNKSLQDSSTNIIEGISYIQRTAGGGISLSW